MFRKIIYSVPDPDQSASNSSSFTNQDLIATTSNSDTLLEASFIASRNLQAELLLQLKDADADPEILMQHMSRIWNENIDALTLSMLPGQNALFGRKRISQTMVATGDLLSSLNPASSSLAYIRHFPEPRKPQLVTTYKTLTSNPKEFNPTSANIYIPIHYHSDESVLSGKLLAKALNYYIGEKRWQVKLYFETANDNAALDYKKKNEWLSRNSNMLAQVSRTLGVSIIVLEHKDMFLNFERLNAQDYFLDKISKSKDVRAGLVQDTRDALSPEKKQKSAIASAAVNKLKPADFSLSGDSDLLDDRIKMLGFDAKLELANVYLLMVNEAEKASANEINNLLYFFSRYVTTLLGQPEIEPELNSNPSPKYNPHGFFSSALPTIAEEVLSPSNQHSLKKITVIG